jgi:hypothetical protein
MAALQVFFGRWKPAEGPGTPWAKVIPGDGFGGRYDWRIVTTMATGNSAITGSFRRRRSHLGRCRVTTA